MIQYLWKLHRAFSEACNDGIGVVFTGLKWKCENLLQRVLRLKTRNSRKLGYRYLKLDNEDEDVDEYGYDYDEDEQDTSENQKQQKVSRLNRIVDDMLFMDNCADDVWNQFQFQWKVTLTGALSSINNVYTMMTDMGLTSNEASTILQVMCGPDSKLTKDTADALVTHWRDYMTAMSCSDNLIAPLSSTSLDSNRMMSTVAKNHYTAFRVIVLKLFPLHLSETEIVRNLGAALAVASNIQKAEDILTVASTIDPARETRGASSFSTDRDAKQLGNEKNSGCDRDVCTAVGTQGERHRGFEGERHRENVSSKKPTTTVALA